MTYQAFFFDFDGVLADSVEVKTCAFAKLFKPYGSEIEAQVVSHHRRNGGMTRKDKFLHYYEEFLNKSLDDDEIERLCNRFSSMIVDELISCPEIRGAEDFLQRWYNKVPCFVVSATPDVELSEIIKRRGLGVYFREILGSNRSKQENIELLIKKYDLKPEKCLFFGDAESDYRAAVSYNVNFIGIIPGLDAPLLRVAQDINWARDFVDLDIDNYIK